MGLQTGLANCFKYTANHPQWENVVLGMIATSSRLKARVPLQHVINRFAHRNSEATGDHYHAILLQPDVVERCIAYQNTLSPGELQPPKKKGRYIAVSLTKLE